MNTTQTTTTASSLVAFLAGLLAGKGVFGFDTGTWTTIIGSVVAAGTAVYTAVVTRKTALVSATAALPEVKAVTLTPEAPTSLVDATPSNVTR